jgi:hypothetical protein
VRPGGAAPHRTEGELSLSGSDDLLDAFVAAWSARRWWADEYRRLGGEVDERGLRMQIIA